MSHPFRQSHLLIQVHEARGLSAPDADTSAQLEAYCTLSTGPLRMTTATARVNRGTAGRITGITSTSTGTAAAAAAAAAAGAPSVRPSVDLIAGSTGLPSSQPSSSSLAGSPDPTGPQMSVPDTTLQGVLSPRDQEATGAVLSLDMTGATPSPPPSPSAATFFSPPSASNLSHRPSASSLQAPTLLEPKSGQQGQLRVSWRNERFLLREDDLILGSMLLGLEVTLSRKWPAFDVTLALAELSLDDDMQQRLLCGEEALLQLQLRPPGKPTARQQQQQQQMLQRGFAGGASTAAGPGQGQGTASASQAGSATGVLLVSVRLQQTALDEAMSGQLAADLMPSVTMEAAGLGPGSVTHSPLASLYVEPCVVYLRLRLLGAVGLKFASQSGTGGAASSSAAKEREASEAAAAAGAAKDAAAATTLTQQVQDWTSEWMKSTSEAWAKRWGTKSAAAGKDELSPASKPPNPPSTSAAAAAAAAGKASGAGPSTSTSSSALPASKGVSRAATAGKQASAGSSSGSGTHARRPVQQHLKGHHQAKGSVDFDVLMNVLETNGFSYTDKGIFNYIWCKVLYEGQEHCSRMLPQESGIVDWGGAQDAGETMLLAALRPVGDAPLELTLFGAWDAKSRGRPVCTAAVPLCDLLAAAGITSAEPRSRTQPQQASGSEGQQHQGQQQTSSGPGQESGQTHGVVHAQGPDQRQVPGQGQGRGQGQQIWAQLRSKAAKVASDLSKAAGGGAFDYDPTNWPRGKVTIKGKMDDGSGIEVTVEVTLVEADERAKAWGLPLLQPQQDAEWEQHCAALPQQPVTWLPRSAGVAVGASQAAPVPAPAAAPVPGPATAASQEPPASSLVRRSDSSSASLYAAAEAAALIATAAAAAAAAAPSTAATATCTPPQPSPSPSSSHLPATTGRLSNVASTTAVELQPVGHTASALVSTQVQSGLTSPQASGSVGPQASGLSRAGSMASEPISPRPSTSHTPANAASRSLSGAPRAQPAAASGPLVAASLPSMCTPTPSTLVRMDHGAEARHAPHHTDGRPSVPAKHVGLLHFIVHNVCLDVDKAFDTFVMFKCGNVWVCSNPVPSSRNPSWGIHCQLPVTHPADVLSLAVYRRTDAGVSKTVNVRTVMGMMGMSTETLLGKLRIRLSTLATGRLHTVDLPLQGERLQSRAGPVIGRATLSVMVEYPSVPAVLLAYMKPPLYPPVLLLSMGCTAGDDLHSPFLGNPDLAVEEDALARKARRVVLGWLEGTCAPGVPHRAARRLLDDGRQDFTLSRTQQNWRRVASIVPNTAPLRQWWNVVRSWQQPSLSLAVSLCTVLWAAFPLQGTVLMLVLAAAALVGYKAMVLSGTDLGVPQPMAEDLPAEPDNPSSAQQAGAGGTDAAPEGPGGSGAVRQSPSQPSLLSRSLQQQAGTTSAAGGGAGGAGAGPGASSSGAPGATPSASQGSGGAGGALSSFFGGSSGAASAAVPMDTLDSLKSQYEGVVSFLALVQNVLDDFAICIERLVALLTWQDELASSLLVAGLLASALAVWLVGVPALIAAMVLIDIRPPFMRDPLPTGGEVLFRYLPHRGDRMM